MTRNGDFSDCGPGCAIFEEEARRAPAVVACYWIDAHADKFGHINAPLDVGHQFSRRLLAGFEMHVGCACSRSAAGAARGVPLRCQAQLRSEEHTSELQSLMRISYAVFCLKKTKESSITNTTQIH